MNIPLSTFNNPIIFYFPCHAIFNSLILYLQSYIKAFQALSRNIFFRFRLDFVVKIINLI